MALSLAISWQTLLSAAQKGTAFPCVKRNTKVSSLSCWLKSSFPLRMPAPLPAGAVGTARRAESRLNFTSSLNLGPVLASFPKKKKNPPQNNKTSRCWHQGCTRLPAEGVASRLPRDASSYRRGTGGGTGRGRRRHGGVPCPGQQPGWKASAIYH